jgi:hypothetical protein
VRLVLASRDSACETGSNERFIVQSYPVIYLFRAKITQLENFGLHLRKVILKGRFSH